LSIISIDEGRIQSVGKILPCPTKYLNICAFGVICEINQSAIELQVSASYFYMNIDTDFYFHTLINHYFGMLQGGKYIRVYSSHKSKKPEARNDNRDNYKL